MTRIMTETAVQLVGRRTALRQCVLLAGIGLLIAVSLYSVGRGAVRIPVSAVLAIFFRPTGFLSRIAVTEQHEAVLLTIRLPRIVFAILTGAGLSASGVAMQGLFRNPLADPSLIGVSSGAALGATAIIVFMDSVGLTTGGTPGAFSLPAAAFGGGFVTAWVIYRLATRSGRTSVSTMLLAGIAINALAQAVGGLITFFATDTALRNLTFWKLGSLGAATWTNVGLLAPLVLIPVFGFPFLSSRLNVFLLGESEAHLLGVPVEATKTLIVVLVSVAVGGTVAFTGLIAFVGLIVPHVLRLVGGPDHRFLFPASAIYGAALMVVADCVARTVVIPAELPIGILTAVFGAPVFLWLLTILKRREELD